MLCVSNVATFDVHASSLVGDARSSPRPLALPKARSPFAHIALSYLALLTHLLLLYFFFVPGMFA